MEEDIHDLTCAASRFRSCGCSSLVIASDGVRGTQAPGTVSLVKGGWSALRTQQCVKRACGRQLADAFGEEGEVGWALSD